MGNALYLGIIALVLATFVVGPIFTIVAINTLFGTSIPLDLAHWAAAGWLQFVLTARFSSTTTN